MLDTILPAGVRTSVAIADGRPGPIDSGAAAREEQIVVDLVVPARRSSTSEEGRRRALECREQVSQTIRRTEVETSEP